VIDEVGLFDPRYFLYCEEIDHCRAVRKSGWSVVYYPFTQIVHVGGESAESVGPLTSAGRQISALQVESELLYFRKHHGLTGLLQAMMLSLVADTLSAGNALVRRFDTGRAETAMKHSWIVLRSLLQTRLASRATR
jgi:N-acetylglucosaminyl-diphospho-decaprenol L-rhamnosyltransferase